MGMTFADLYGQVGVAEPQLEQASGGTMSQSGITVSWLGMVILLVALRILYEIADEV